MPGRDAGGLLRSRRNRRRLIKGSGLKEGRASFCIMENKAVSYDTETDMIPGSKGRKADASLLARGFLTLRPAQNMNKEPFFEEK